jgi:hypothetical protein
MAETYRSKYGIDWDVTWTDTFIDMTVAKKWRLFKRLQGIDLSGIAGECLEKAVLALFPDHVKMSPWTRQIVHDFAVEDKYALIGCGSCGKSYAMAALGIVYWLTDPYNTTVIIGSATLKDLSTRAWAPTLLLFSSLKNNAAGLPIPGKIVSNQYAIVNEKDLAAAETADAKSAIQGRALDEGRIYGTHNTWVMLVVDELALVNDIEALKKALTNIRIGTLGFKFISAANPDPWDSPRSVFYLPENGQKVDVDTGSWRSSMGYFVRHFDGMKSPVVLNPKLKDEYPFLMSQEDVSEALINNNGDSNAAGFFKMVRGFPLASGQSVPTVLDPLDAARQRVTEPLERPMSGLRVPVGLAAGVDPAWSEGGDAAVYAGVNVVSQDGRVYLDFQGRTSRMMIAANSPDPVTLQLRNGVLTRIMSDGGPRVDKLYVDSSGNQGLADDLDLFVGPGCGHINASTRASEVPIRALDQTPANQRVRDRGAEAWVVLAEFCRAGQVRGLPQEALDGLIRRRFAMKPGSNVPASPLRLEGKEDFMKRCRGGSPNQTDACALAALAVKERLGVLPYGGVPAPQASSVVPQAYSSNHANGPDYAVDPDYANGDGVADIALYDAE